MVKFRDIGALQRFVSIHASVHILFNQERDLNPREPFKQDRAAVLAEWRHPAA